MPEIRLANTARVALVDEGDYDLVSAHSWRFASGYAITEIDGRTTGMHRLILGLVDPDLFTDHVNHDTLDNRRSNLRAATLTESNRNRRGWGGTSRFKGVRRIPGRKTWDARIRCDGILRHIGCYPTEEEAARAYDAEARRLFGRFAKCNFEEGAA